MLSINWELTQTAGHRQLLDASRKTMKTMLVDFRKVEFNFSWDFTKKRGGLDFLVLSWTKAELP